MLSYRYLACCIGALLLRRLKRAVVECKVQNDAFEAFSEQQADQVPAWKEMVENFEMDGSKPNPYELPKSGEL